jgi:uncharacterized protein (TIGR03437 family)
MAPIWQSATSTWNGDFPTSLAGTSVTIDGKSAYLWFVNPTQINLQAPDDTATGTVAVVVTTATGTATSTVTLAPSGPSFSLLDAKHVTAIILRPDRKGDYGGGAYDIVGPTGSSLGYATVAAKAGDVVELFGVGFGPTSPGVPAGQAFSGAAAATNTIVLLVNHTLRERDQVGLVVGFEGEAKADVAEGVGLAAFSFKNITVEQAATLVETGKAETERETLVAQNVRDDEVIAGHRSKVQRAEVSLKKLMDLGGCNTAQGLEATIAASEQKAEKQEEYERIAQGLIERNAAPDVREIEEEAAGHDLDSLQSAIASGGNRQKELQDEVFKTGSEYGTLLQDFEHLQASDESTVEAQKAEDALGRVRPAIAHYLRLQIAAEVLQRSIKRYREKHQGPVLARANDLFSSLTQGDYSGLTTAFGDNDKTVLVAIRRNTENIEIEGLSDGTRDQLYLALRLAAIEHHVETVSPCPVILDDILINADNARASATLKVLGYLARQTQVLFFTHHRHLEKLGREAGAQIIDLNAQAVASIA